MRADSGSFGGLPLPVSAMPGESPFLSVPRDLAGPPRAEVERDLWVGAMTAAFEMTLDYL